MLTNGANIFALANVDNRSNVDNCSRAKSEQLERFLGLLPERQGQKLALTVLFVPYLLDERRLGLWAWHPQHNDEVTPRECWRMFHIRSRKGLGGRRGMLSAVFFFCFFFFCITLKPSVE